MQLIIPETLQGQRLDKALAQLLPEYSRSYLQTVLKNAQLTVAGQAASGKMLVKGGEAIQLTLETPPIDTVWQSEAMALNIVYEDQALLIIDKPVGLVVHPAAGNWSGTLVNGILHHSPANAALPRAGIVHRLDKDTSGLLIVAKSLTAYHSLVQQLQARQITRQYCALVYGSMTSGGTIEAPIARHPKDRQKMAIVPQGKIAITHYRLRERFQDFTLLKILLETGRTHQIRVHMAASHHPLVGDAVYGHGLRFPKKASLTLKNALKAFDHQALHAERLTFKHPISQQTLYFKAAMPQDMQDLLALLRQEQSGLTPFESEL